MRSSRRDSGIRSLPRWITEDLGGDASADETAPETSCCSVDVFAVVAAVKDPDRSFEKLLLQNSGPFTHRGMQQYWKASQYPHKCRDTQKGGFEAGRENVAAQARQETRLAACIDRWAPVSTAAVPGKLS